MPLQPSRSHGPTLPWALACMQLTQYHTHIIMCIVITCVLVIHPRMNITKFMFQSFQN